MNFLKRMVSILCIAALCVQLMSTGVVAALAASDTSDGPIYANDFEKDQVGTALDWTATMTHQNTTFTVEQANGGQAAQLKQTAAIGGASNVYYRLPVTPQTQKTTVELDMMCTNKASAFFFVCDSNGKIITQIDFRVDGVLGINNGSIIQVGKYNTNEWYRIKIDCDVQAATYDVSINGAPATTYAFREAAQNVGLLQVGINRNYANTVYYDNLQVYEYVAPADYTAVKAALATVPADLSIYTSETAAAVTAAVDAVVYGLAAEEQESVDAMAAAILDAVSKLVLNTTEDDEAAAAAVDALIDTLPGVDEVTKEDADAVYAVSAEYAKLSAVGKELTEGKEKLLGLEAQLNVLNDRYGIANLVSYDDVNDHNWTVRRNAKVGDQFYGDRSVTFGSLPAYLDGADYIRPAQSSKMWAGGDTMIEFDVYATTNLYVGWNLNVAAPAWLTENFEQTTDAVVRSDGPVLTLFRRQVAAGEHIKLGYLGQNGDIYMVLLQNHSPEKPAEPAPAQKELSRVVKVACVGDSITYGSGASDRATTSYPPQLGKLLGKSYEVKNFGLGGTTLMSAGDKPYIQQTQYTDSLAYNPDIVIIMLGTNDSKGKNSALIAANFKNDLIALIETYQALSSNPKVYVATSPYCMNTSVGSNTINGVVIEEQILPIQKAVAEELGLELVDMHTATFEQSIFPDNVHPNDEGYQLVSRTFFDAIAEYLPDDVVEIGAAAAAVDKMIEELGEITSLEQKADVEAARAAYEALSNAEKAKVTKLAALEAAEDAINDLENAGEAAAAAAAVDKMIEDLGEITSLEQKADVEAARAAYEALTATQKAMVKNADKLDEAENAIKALEDQAAEDLEDQAAADAVTKMIEDLGEITSLEQEEAVVAARAAYDALTEAQQAKVSKEAVDALEAAEAAIAAMKEPAYADGDVDKSGTVDVADIMKLKALIMADKWSPEELTIGDLNESDALDVGDIMAVKNIIMSK